MSSIILSITTFIYFFASLFYILYFIFKKELFGRVAIFISIIGFTVNTIGIIYRWKESYDIGIGHAPLSNLYESLIFFSWTIILIYLIIEYKYRNIIIGVFASTFAFLSMAYAALSPNIDSRIQPLIPALKSNWLIAHVFTCFLGYAAFSIAFAISLIYLLKEKGEILNLKGYFPNSAVLDELTYQIITFGFLFLSIGIITGAVWANSAWGTYWSWDPKETWSLITWLIYAALLHARLTRGWQGERIAYLSIIGFLAVIFTYFGVNYLPGLHSYGQQ